VHHQPLRWIESNGIGFFDSFQPSPKFGADEGTASISAVHMQPQIERLAYIADLIESIKGTSSRRAQCCTHLETNLINQSHQKSLATDHYNKRLKIPFAIPIHHLPQFSPLRADFIHQERKVDYDFLSFFSLLEKRNHLLNAALFTELICRLCRKKKETLFFPGNETTKSFSWN
jgi:hypothetical protein